jgi:hypothetical protein
MESRRRKRVGWRWEAGGIAPSATTTGTAGNGARPTQHRDTGRHCSAACCTLAGDGNQPARLWEPQRLRLLILALAGRMVWLADDVDFDSLEIGPGTTSLTPMGSAASHLTAERGSTSSTLENGETCAGDLESSTRIRPRPQQQSPTQVFAPARTKLRGSERLCALGPQGLRASGLLGRSRSARCARPSAGHCSH